MDPGLNFLFVLLGGVASTFFVVAIQEFIRRGRLLRQRQALEQESSRIALAPEPIASPRVEEQASALERGPRDRS